MVYTAAVITISDKGFRGERVDTSGPALCAILTEHGYKETYTAIIPDDTEQIKRELMKCTDELGIHLVLTTGGTGFSPKDVTPEAALAVIERETRGIPELMRAESMKITDRGCLSRSVAGVRRKSLIITLPGSEKAAKENLLAVMNPIAHGLEMLLGSGSADCGEHHHRHKKVKPSVDDWLREAKSIPNADKIGMYLTHNGIVRSTAKAMVRSGETDTEPVSALEFSYDKIKVDSAIAETLALTGIYHVQVWLNEGVLNIGDDIMQVLIGGDIRPRVVDALQYLVSRIKNDCVVEKEIYEERR